MNIHTLWKSICLLALIIGGVWIYSWYKGHYGPSALDTTAVVHSMATSTDSDMATTSIAYVAGGCFWCTESDFEKLPGVLDVVSGYMGGTKDHPTYTDVSSGDTGHRESVKIVYDPQKLSYKQLVFWLLRHSDPTDADGSFFDRGTQYASAIFYSNQTEKTDALTVIQKITALEIFPKPIVTAVLPAGSFWIAESYHQDFYRQNPIRYQYYRKGSGRDAYIASIWGSTTFGSSEYDYLFNEWRRTNTSGTHDMRMPAASLPQQTASTTASTYPWEHFIKPAPETLRATLTPLQYEVTQNNGTEKPFDNAYAEHTSAGIYVDIVSGEPLYASIDKYDSGTGWPSFTKPISPEAVLLKEDRGWFSTRTEVRSRYADSHLGHVFDDGPKDRGGKRYCMNSAALRFIPQADLVKEGYGQFVSLFK